jgi:anti-sigma factor RsiW
MRHCRQVSEELSDVVDGSLPLYKRLAARLHLWVCPPCRATEHSLRFTRDVLRKLSCAPLADEAELGETSNDKR